MDKITNIERKTYNSMPLVDYNQELNELATYDDSERHTPLKKTLSSMKSLFAVQEEARVEHVIPQAPPPRHEESPSPFVQELVHLFSLMSAVSFATLRNDVEGIEIPLEKFMPSAPWPPVDPDVNSPEIRKSYHQGSRFVTGLKYLFGMTRTSKQRTLYNAARPFRVIGGVSDREMKALRAARGMVAKVTIVKLWVEAFISREYMAGATGKVAPPILSRLYQYISDGMIGYHQARKISFVPFPFPHAQLTALFNLVMLVFMPIMMISFTDRVYVAAVINFFCVSCFVGLHEVALELENPFQNPPNDIPLNRFHAMYNEALMVLFSGNHPDAWWQEPAQNKKDS
mmetsp:Transcript_1643/g.2105  ORF Transcript_1643/g.2105 Transcript_1643/m.2105 type:complete len:343 (-) Transcript_1643:81-1109(-)